MIYGIGTDIVRIKRIEELYNNYREKFVEKILTNLEIEKFNSFAVKRRKISYLAKRFAAKEAFVKALGTGFRGEINFNNIGVLNNKLGKPKMLLSKKIKDIIPNNIKIHTSLSDEVDLVVAFVIIETT